MRATGNRAILSLLVVAGGFALASCTDEEIVYRERPIYQEPVEAALDFIGYSDPENEDNANLTVCGNCHIGQQAEWEQTAHAMAWEGLQSSDHAAAACEGCHTVNSFGNTTEEQTPGTPEGGWAATSDVRYHDVQCENCHGPGLPHVRNPDAIDTRPLAPIVVGSDLSFGCGECHSGAHHPFVDEWENSPHAHMNAYPAGRDAANGGCFFCHSGEGALQKWGVKANYLEKEELLASNEEFANITCAVCHDPHDNTNEHQLRFPVNTASIENHLCAQCHNRRTDPDPSSSHGLEPHSPESALLVGDAGWFAPGSEINPGEILGTHGSERNTELCATCHVHAYSHQDEETGQSFRSVGHAFRAAPCLNENGTPSGAEDCALTTTARSFDGCVSGECHPSETTVLGVLQSSLISVLDRAQQLEELLEIVDPNLDAGGGAIDPSDPTFTVAEGAFFNLHLAHHPTGLTASMTRQDSLLAFMPSTVHNPFLIESLLITSIQAVENEYSSVLPDMQLDLTPRLTRPQGIH